MIQEYYYRFSEFKKPRIYLHISILRVSHTSATTLSINKMTLFYGTWKIMDTARVPCMTIFASMSKEDDARESVGVELLGRWSDVGRASGYLICRAESYAAVVSWMYNWAT